MTPTTPSSPVHTTLTLFGIKSGHWRWGLAQMGTSVRPLQKVKGLKFFKLLGSGKGRGFSLSPNWYRYGLMATWESPFAAEDFFQGHPLLEDYRQHTEEQYTLALQPLQAHGLWSGQNPFTQETQPSPANAPIAVLTRASIRLTKAIDFWKNVPKASKSLDHAEGLLASIGLGEAPFIRQATFSLWRDETSMKAYAYRQAAHREVIKRTRSQGWYSEELFARFTPLSSKGTWNGVDPLAGLL
ncbi:spheroidene monooxygenase [Rufibacter latericius]|uniref:Spheroidene monooxygenase n=1 Tax=Rufibacter latericius TaxID=2487040 RepID=A0A3M9MYI2_9BACT|nr:spheroidene monooxygenase [Rufibacter latericius]RNI30540.1 spheroidene monooxygenase [Rufibacter latericius]